MRAARPLNAPDLRRTLPAAFVAVLAVFAGHSLAGDVPSRAEGAPLTVTPDQADLGEVSEGTAGLLEFTIANGEMDAVRLTYIFAECDCSFDLPPDGVVPAGDTFVLGVRYNLDEAAVGRWDETITILIDHPRQQEIRIPITAYILPESYTDSVGGGG